MRERFVGEAIEPVVETVDTEMMAAGGPGLPREFIWRGKRIVVAGIVRSWKETGPCRHGSPEMYVRKHWYEIVTPAGDTMKIYFDRQPRGGRKGPRWWLFTVHKAEQGRNISSF